jgi:hypothetical protein
LNFSLKIGYTGSLKWEKISTNGCFKLHIYLRANKTLIRNSLGVFDSGGTYLSHKKYIVQLQQENVYPKGQDDPVNWRSG